MKMVKVARVGSKLVEVAVQSGATIRECLTAAGISMRNDECVFENHILRDVGTNVLNNAVIVVEPKKRDPLSDNMINLIEVLMDHDILEEEDYEDDDCNIDFLDAYDDNKEMIRDIIAAAKEV